MKKEVDEIDTKILQRLIENARVDLKDIAKDCFLTPSAVLKRIQRLKEAKVIIGTSLIVRKGLLGYPQEATVGITADSYRIDDIAKKVRSLPNVIVCAKSIGRYNLFAHVFTQDLPELDRVTHFIRNISGIRGISINIHLDNNLDQLSIGDKIVEPEPCSPDAMGLKIVGELLEDSQRSFLEISKKIGIAHETVRQRIEKMIRTRLLRCSIVIDRSKLGYQGTAFFLISCSEGSTDDTIKALRNIRMRSACKVIGGAFDIFAATQVRDLKDLGILQDSIEKIPSIQNVETGILMFTYYSFAPKPGHPYQCDTVELC